MLAMVTILSQLNTNSSSLVSHIHLALYLTPLPPCPPLYSLPSPLCWPLLLVHPVVHSTVVAHWQPRAVLPPGGGGGGGAVGARGQGGDGEMDVWSLDDGSW